MLDSFLLIIGAAGRDHKVFKECQSKSGNKRLLTSLRIFLRFNWILNKHFCVSLPSKMLQKKEIWASPSHLEHLGAHLGSRAPLSTQLHRESLPVLCEDPHPDRVYQNLHQAQPLLLNRVEYNQVPGEGKESWKAQDGGWGDQTGDVKKSRLYLGPAGSNSIKVRWGKASWVARLSS